VLGRPAEGLDDDALAEALRARDGADLDDGPGFQALEASASFDRALYDGNEFGAYAAAGSDEEQDFLGLPGLLEPDQVAALLRQRQALQAGRGQPKRGPRAAAAQPDPPVEEVPAYERAAALRRQLSGLVAAHAARSGRPHAEIHAELRRRCGGPPTAQATADQLAARLAALARLGA
jgi:hypothetical protein